MEVENTYILPCMPRIVFMFFVIQRQVNFSSISFNCLSYQTGITYLIFANPLLNHIVHRLESETSDLRIGLGGFVDKVNLPFITERDIGV